jgi:hypothetical protein
MKELRLLVFDCGDVDDFYNISLKELKELEQKIKKALRRSNVKLIKGSGKFGRGMAKENQGVFMCVPHIGAAALLGGNSTNIMRKKTAETICDVVLREMVKWLDEYWSVILRYKASWNAQKWTHCVLERGHH